MLAKISLMAGLVVLAFVIGLGVAGVGDGEFHDGTVVGKGIIGGRPDTQYFLVDEGNEENTVLRVLSWPEYYTTDIGDNISWEDRGVIHVVLAVPGFIASVVVLFSVFVLAEEKW